MNLQDLMKKISDKDIPHFLIFWGEESEILRVYLDKIQSLLGATRIDCDTVSMVVSKVGKKSLTKTKKLYVVKDDISFSKEEDAWRKVKKLVKKDYLILWYHDKLDKRSLFVKRNDDCITEFSKLGKDVLKRYIEKIVPNLSDDYCSDLIEYCSSDYGRILLELDKINQYRDYINNNICNVVSTDDCFDELDKQGLFYKEIGDITFELTDAVLGGYPDKAIEKLDEAKRKGEPAITIASILYRGFRNLLAYQGLGSNKKDAVQRTGLTKGELWGCTKNAGGYSTSEIKRNMLLCQKVECGIKTGTIDESITLDYLVLSCLK